MLFHSLATVTILKWAKLDVYHMEFLFITLHHVSKHPVLLYQTFLFLQITYQLPVCVFNPASETFFDTVITGCPLR